MIYTPLCPHQDEALEFAMPKPKASLVMHMGYGKSLVALAKADRMGARRILITSDKNNVMNNWPEQIAKHTDFECVVRPKTIPDSDSVMCVVVNYQYLVNRKSEYRLPWDLWIGDESSDFKNQRANLSLALRSVISFTKNRIILNAIPLTESLEDLFGQYLVLDNGERLCKSISHFHNKFMQPERNGYGWVPKRDSFTNIRKAIDDITFWLEKDPRIKMPEQIYHRIEVDMTPEQKEVDDELQEMFSACYDQREIETNYAPVVFSKRVQLSGGIFRPTDDIDLDDDPRTYVVIPTAKLPVVCKLVMENPESKIVIWHVYRPETEILAKSLREVLPVGDLSVFNSPDDRDSLSEYESNRSRVLLIRTSFCKGLNNLGATDITAFYSLPFAYIRRVQAIGRSCRMDSPSDRTHIVDVVTKGGADFIVYKQLQQKLNISSTLSGIKRIVDALQQ